MTAHPTTIADLKDLRRIPGIGSSLAQDLADLGIRRVTDLRRRNPERLYERLCKLRGEHIDRCVLYTFRCAVYFATEPRPDRERLKWWNWKDTQSARRTKSSAPAASSPKRARSVRAEK